MKHTQDDDHPIGYYHIRVLVNSEVALDNWRPKLSDVISDLIGFLRKYVGAGQVWASSTGFSRTSLPTPTLEVSQMQHWFLNLTTYEAQLSDEDLNSISAELISAIPSLKGMSIGWMYF